MIEKIRETKDESEQEKLSKKLVTLIQEKPYTAIQEYEFDLQRKLIDVGLEVGCLSKSVSEGSEPRRDPYYSPHVGGSQEYFGTVKQENTVFTVTLKANNIQDFKIKRTILESVKKTVSSFKESETVETINEFQRTARVVFKLHDPVYDKWKTLGNKKSRLY